MRRFVIFSTRHVDGSAQILQVHPRLCCPAARRGENKKRAYSNNEECYGVNEMFSTSEYAYDVRDQSCDGSWLRSVQSCSLHDNYLFVCITRAKLRCAVATLIPLHHTCNNIFLMPPPSLPLTLPPSLSSSLYPSHPPSIPLPLPPSYPPPIPLTLPSSYRQVRAVPYWIDDVSLAQSIKQSGSQPHILRYTVPYYTTLYSTALYTAVCIPMLNFNRTSSYARWVQHYPQYRTTLFDSTQEHSTHFLHILILNFPDILFQQVRRICWQKVAKMCTSRNYSHTMRGVTWRPPRAKKPPLCW